MLAPTAVLFFSVQLCCLLEMCDTHTNSYQDDDPNNDASEKNIEL